MFIKPHTKIDLANILLVWSSTLMLFSRNLKFIHNNILLSNLLLCLSFIIFVITIFFAIFRLIKSKKLENKTYTRLYSWMVIITSSLGISYLVLANLIIYYFRKF